MFKKWMASVLMLAFIMGSWTVPARAEAPLFDSLQETADYVRSRAGERASQISFTLEDFSDYEMETSELRRDLIQYAPEVAHVSFEEIYYANGNLGIIMYPTYRDGVRMVDAWRSGDLNGLNDRELAALRVAQELVSTLQARCSTELELEKAIFDELCARLTYTARTEVQEGELVARELTTAEALLTGRVNCQGYAGAFYLLASLAGFEVGMQNGFNEREMHVWNTVKLDGKWYVVDVTAGDSDGNVVSDEFANYMLFNAGMDVARTALGWSYEWQTVGITQTSDENYFFRVQDEKMGYTCGSVEWAARIIYELRRDEGRETCWLMLPGLGDSFQADDFHEALKKVVQKENHGPTNWTIYYWTPGGNVYLYAKWNQF